MVHPLPFGALPGAILLGLLLSGPPEARAFTLNRTEQGMILHWEQSEVIWVLSGRLAGVDEQDFANAVQAGFLAWNLPGESRLRLSHGGPAVQAVVGYDREHPEQNENLVTVEDGEWGYEAQASAITVTTYVTETGEILDADVVLRGAALEWSLGLPGTTDVQNTIAHEAGHFLGLGHSPQVPEATMYPFTYPGETSKRTIHPDDVAGLLRLYGTGEGQSNTYTEVDAPAIPVKVESEMHQDEEEPYGFQVHCGAARGGPGAGWPGLLLLVLALIRRRIACSRG